MIGWWRLLVSGVLLALCVGCEGIRDALDPVIPLDTVATQVQRGIREHSPKFATLSVQPRQPYRVIRGLTISGWLDTENDKFDAFMLAWRLADEITTGHKPSKVDGIWNEMVSREHIDRQGHYLRPVERRTGGVNAEPRNPQGASGPQ